MVRRSRRPLASVDGDLNGGSPSKRFRRASEGNLNQKRIDSFFSGSPQPKFLNSQENPIKDAKESSSTPRERFNSSVSSISNAVTDVNESKDSVDIECSHRTLLGVKVGVKELNASCKVVSHRHSAIYGSDVSLWGNAFAPLVSGEDSEPLHPWFENAFNAYISSDSGDEEFHSYELNQKNDEESWLKILTLLNNSLSPKLHLSFTSLHKLLVSGVAHKDSPTVRVVSANLFRRIIHFLAVPDSKKLRSYYLKALAREEKGVDEFDDMEPWELLEFVLESLFSGSMRYAHLFTVLVELIELDFDLWYRKSNTCLNSDALHQPPIIYKIMRFSGEPRLNVYSQKIVQTYVSALLDTNSKKHIQSLRTLVSILAQITGYKNNENKSEFVHFFAQIIKDQDSLLHSSRQVLLMELYLLKPSWLSFCLSNSLIGHLANTRQSRGQTISLRSALESYIQCVTNEREENEPDPRQISSPRKISLKKIHIPVDKRNAYGETPLHVACKKGNLERVLAILNSPKLDVNAKDHNGWTPLHEACAHNMMSCVRALMEFKPINIKHFLIKGSNRSNDSKRVDLLATAGENGINPFHDCIISDNLELVTFIMEKVRSDAEFPSIKTLLSSTTLSGQSCMDLASSKEMRLVLQGFNEKVSVPRKMIVNSNSFEMIKFILINFMSKYVSYFGLHVQKDFIKFISKKEKKNYIRYSGWKCPSHRPNFINANDLCSYQRSRETSVRDIRSYCSLLNTVYVNPEIKKIIQLLK